MLVLTGFGIYIYYNGFKPEYKTGGLLSVNQARFDVSFYDINLEVFPEKERISGHTTIVLTSLSDSLSELEIDLIDTYRVDSVIINNQPLPFKHYSDKVLISLAHPVNNLEMIRISIYYNGSPPEALRPPWQGGFTWDRDGEGNAWIGLSCQGEGAKIWFPCKDHPTDEPDSAAINITVPEKYFVAANGLLKSKSTPRDGFTTYHWLTLYPINNYLINFGVGLYQEVSTEYVAKDGSKMPVVFYTLPDLLEGSQDFVEEAAKMLKSYSTFFGEYPWKNEKCGLLNTPFSGMEHQTLISYGNRYRRNYIGDFGYDALLLHELAHEWWGNKITVRDWSDFWIQEGIATYAECLYILDQQGEAAYHECMDETKERIRNSRPVKSPPNTSSAEAYHSDIYSKGAAFMHSLRYILGDSVFFSSLMAFSNDSSFYKNGVSTDDFLRLLNKNSAMELDDLFELYLETTELPHILVDSISVNTFEISIPNIDFEIPMDVYIERDVERIYLGPEAVEINSFVRPEVDPLNWFLKE